MKVHHVGYITNSIEESIVEFRYLGYKLCEGGIFDDSNQNCRICMLSSSIDGNKIELVEPFPNNFQMSKLLKKRGNSVYHICYEVEDIHDCYKTFCSKEGWMNIFEPKVAIALENRLITYFYNIKIGFVEFLNSK